MELAAGKLQLDFPAEHVARLTIDHPAKRNALDHEILDALAGVLGDLEARCLLITAAGPVFSAGYDIGNLPRGEFADQAEALVAHPFHAAIEALDAYPYPTVAALNGHAIGGGLELALACDLRVASADAKLGMPPARLGLVYSHTGLRRFLDAIGAPRTRELFFTARNVPARTALAWGLVNDVVAAGEVAAHGARARRPDRLPRPALARREQARAARAAARRGGAGPGDRARAGRAARGVLPQRGPVRGRARVRREARPALDRPLGRDPSPFVQSLHVASAAADIRGAAKQGKPVVRRGRKARGLRRI